MSLIIVSLYLIVILILIYCIAAYFKLSKAAAIITLIFSPVYLAVAHFLSPYINWHGKFDGIFRFAVELGFSHQNAVG